MYKLKTNLPWQPVMRYWAVPAGELHLHRLLHLLRRAVWSPVLPACLPQQLPWAASARRRGFACSCTYGQAVRARVQHLHLLVHTEGATVQAARMQLQRLQQLQQQLQQQGLPLPGPQDPYWQAAMQTSLQASTSWQHVLSLLGLLSPIAKSLERRTLAPLHGKGVGGCHKGRSRSGLHAHPRAAVTSPLGKHGQELAAHRRGVSEQHSGRAGSMQP